MTKFREIYNKYEEIENLKYKRELLNMKLTLSILNQEDKKHISHIRAEIKRITKIIGGKYIDAYEWMQIQIKKTVSDLLSKEITEETAYTHAEELEEYILNQDYKIKEEFEIELIKLYETYEKLGYTPINIEKDFLRVKQDTIQTNKKDYINQVLYNLMATPKDENNIPIIQLLREEIVIKTKEKAIKKIKKKRFKLV